jgi:hypothetical protein
LAPASAFPGILERQFWPLNLAILLPIRGPIERKVDARLMEMIEFEEIGLRYRWLQKLSGRRRVKAFILTQTKGIHRRLIMSLLRPSFEPTSA